MSLELKRKLLRLEDGRWEAFEAELERVRPDQMLELGVTPDWSVKDLLAHMGCWMAEAGLVLEQLRFGTYEGWDRDIDEVNAEFYEACKDLDLVSVRAEWYASRTRMLLAWFALEVIDAVAAEWFRESGPEHHDEHLPDLRGFADRLVGASPDAGRPGGRP
jgi:hypothetical protein